MPPWYRGNWSCAPKLRIDTTRLPGGCCISHKPGLGIPIVVPLKPPSLPLGEAIVFGIFQGCRMTSTVAEGGQPRGHTTTKKSLRPQIPGSLHPCWTHCSLAVHAPLPLALELCWCPWGRRAPDRVPNEMRWIMSHTAGTSSPLH